MEPNPHIKPVTYAEAVEKRLFPYVEESETPSGKRFSIRVFSPVVQEGILQGNYAKREEAERDLREFAIPLPGDAVRLTGSYIGVKPGGIAIIDGLIDKPEAEYLVMFHAQAFRDDSMVSCGGGPGLYIPLCNLRYTGKSYNGFFWKWRDRPRADGGMYFRQVVNLWDWDGSNSIFIANIFSNGYHQRLQITTEDMEELIVRCGWTIVDGIKGLTEEGRAEIERLRAQPYVTSKFDSNDTQGAQLWWQKRLISKTPALTPDM